MGASVSGWVTRLMVLDRTGRGGGAVTSGRSRIGRFPGIGGGGPGVPPDNDPSPSIESSPALEPEEGVGFLTGRGGFGLTSPVPFGDALVGGGREAATMTGLAGT